MQNFQKSTPHFFAKPHSKITDNLDCEVTFLESKHLVSFTKALDVKSNKWTAPSKELLSKKLLELSKEKEIGFEKVEIFFEDGKSWIGIVIKEHHSIVELHKFIRKALSSTLSDKKKERLGFDFSKVKKSAQPHLLDAVGSLIALHHWEPAKFGKVAKKEVKSKNYTLYFFSQLSPAQAKKNFENAQNLAEANNLVRSLADLPSNFLGPSEYRKILTARARQNKYSYKFLDRKELIKMKAGAFLSVTQADPKDEGGIAHLTYKPKSKSAKRVVLIGKGLCFDTGGHNIKTGNYMYSMHRDMTGSAVALATFEALVKAKVHFEVHALLALAENLVSPSAFRPNDVVIAMDGTSIEVVDTDAEGRMVLSDTLFYGSQLKPHLMIDFATLTGAAVRSVGTERAAIFSNQKNLLKLAHEAGEECGEVNWAFPIGQEYEAILKSEIADLKQCSASPGPDHIHAATFLSHFAGSLTPWLHVDLSCEDNKGGLGLVASSTTGYGVRLAHKVIEKFF